MKNFAIVTSAVGIVLSVDQFFYNGRFIDPVIDTMRYFASALAIDFG
jgi:hypothetical protein